MPVLHTLYIQQGCYNGNIGGLYLYFSQLKLEEVWAGGSHKHSRKELRVWFHLNQKKKEHGVHERSKQEAQHIKSLSSRETA